MWTDRLLACMSERRRNSVRESGPPDEKQAGPSL